MNEIVIVETKNGKVTENTTEGCFEIFVYSCRDFDGIKGDCTNKYVINYKTGLFQSWDALGYSADIYRWYKDRDYALERAINKIK